MALQDVFLSPLALGGLVAIIPIVLLYLVQPDPRRVELPTIRFLFDESQRDAANPLFERLKRNLLLLIQILVVVGLVVALAGPYVSVTRSQTVEETVLVVDASASMATEREGATRFESALGAARASTSGTNSVVVAGSEPRIVVRDGGATEVESALDDLAVTDAPGDLNGAITQASSLAGENARIVIFSDFAGDTGWADAVRAARARGLQVDLRQLTGGGAANVGIVDRTFTGHNVTLSVKHFGDAPTTRTIRLGDQTRSIDLAPGGVERVTLTVPAGGGEATLSPGDSFPVDDRAFLAAPTDPTVDVLLVTNDPDRYLRTALSVIDEVRLTVGEPPTTVEGQPDVIVYSDTNPDRLLDGTVAAGRETIERGGGVAVLAQPDPPASYGNLMLVDPNGVGSNPSIGRVATHELTRDIDFPPPESYLRGSLRGGSPLVETTDETPLLAADVRGPGRLLYYGYVPDGDTFRYYFQYPVFWKRAIYHLADRQALPSLNREAGARLQFGNQTRVETPDGSVTARTIRFDRTGYYTVGDRRLGVSLFSEPESAVATTPLAQRSDESAALARQEESRVPSPLTWAAALVALALVLGEVGYLRRRGDL